MLPELSMVDLSNQAMPRNWENKLTLMDFWLAVLLLKLLTLVRLLEVLLPQNSRKKNYVLHTNLKNKRRIKKRPWVKKN